MEFLFPKLIFLFTERNLFNLKIILEINGTDLNFDASTKYIKYSIYAKL